VNIVVKDGETCSFCRSYWNNDHEAQDVVKSAHTSLHGYIGNTAAMVGMFFEVQKGFKAEESHGGNAVLQ
jgi:hypothetical protein